MRVLAPLSLDIPNCFECDVNKPRKVSSRAKTCQKAALRQIGIMDDDTFMCLLKWVPKTVLLTYVALF